MAERRFVMVTEQYPLPLHQQTNEDYIFRPSLLMKQRGWDVTIATIALGGQAHEETLDGLVVKRFSRLFKLFLYLRKIKPELVHVQGARGGLLFLPFAAKNVVVTAENAPLSAVWWKRMAHKWLENHFGRILCLTPFEIDEMAEYIRDPDKLRQLPPAVDFKFYSTPVDRTAARRRLGLPEGAFVVVHGGDFQDGEQSLALLRAFVRFTLDWPIARLLVIGRNVCDPQIRDAMEDLLSEECLQDRVTFTGRELPEGVRATLAAGDCLITSSIGEGRNLSVYEGFCQKLPASLPRLGVFKSVFPHALYHDDEHQLAVNLFRLAMSPRLRAELGEACFALMPQFDYRVLEPQLLKRTRNW